MQRKTKDDLKKEIMAMNFDGFELFKIDDDDCKTVVGYFSDANGLWIRVQGDTKRGALYSFSIATAPIFPDISVDITPDTPLDKIIPHILAIKEILEAENAA